MLLALYGAWGAQDKTPPGVSFMVFGRIIIAAFLISQLLATQVS